MLERALGVLRGNRYSENPWLLPLLLALGLLYWMFVWYLERIDLTVVITPYWPAAMPVPLPGFVVFSVELIHPRVLRHFIPVIIGWYMAYSAAVSLVQALFDLPERQAAKDYLRLLVTRGGSLGAPEMVGARELESLRKQSVLLRVGGPGYLLLGNASAAVTELNGRVDRILGPGLHRISRLEHIRAVIDLRPQDREATDIPLVTRDGIEVSADVSITFRQSAGGKPATRARPFPYDDDAVRQAAYNELVLSDNRVATWESVPLSVTKAILAEIVMQYHLDELLHPLMPGSEPHLTLRNELERKTRAALRGQGIELLNVRIGRLELPPEVAQQYISYWQAHLETQAHLTRTDGAAIALEEIEVARAEAEVAMMQAIVEGVAGASRDAGARSLHDVVALRLVESLRGLAQRAEPDHPLPGRLLPDLAEMERELLPETEAEQTGDEG